MSSYEQGQAFGGVIDVLEAIGAEYAIWGGMAVVAYGQPRFTQDMDVLLNPRDFALALFVKRLRETHYHVDELAVRGALAGGFFNVIHLGYHIKVDFWVATTPDHKGMIAERVYYPFDEARRAAYVSATALIIAKLRAFKDSESTRHLEDITSIVQIQGNKLLQSQIDVEAAKLGLLGRWRALWEANRAA